MPMMLFNEDVDVFNVPQCPKCIISSLLSYDGFLLDKDDQKSMNCIPFDHT